MTTSRKCITEGCTVQTTRADGLCSPCRMGSVASEHVPRTSEANRQDDKSIGGAMPRSGEAMSHEERWEKAKRDAEQAMKDLGLEDEPRPGDDQAKTSAVEATGAGGRDTARSEADSSRGKEEGAPADAPPATHGERKDEPRPGGGSRYTYTHDVPQPLPHRNTTRSLRVSSEAKAKSFEYWIEDRDGNEHHGPFETYEEAAKNCRITKGEKIVNRDIPRSETAPACLAPDVACSAEPKWSGRCGEHYWRMVAGQEPGQVRPTATAEGFNLSVTWDQFDKVVRERDRLRREVNTHLAAVLADPLYGGPSIAGLKAAVMCEACEHETQTCTGVPDTEHTCGREQRRERARETTNEATAHAAIGAGGGDDDDVRAAWDEAIARCRKIVQNYALEGDPIEGRYEIPADQVCGELDERMRLLGEKNR
jgi:YD repeat-containing protein